MDLHNLASDYPNAAFSYRAFLDFNPLSGERKTRRLAIPNNEMRALHHQIIRHFRNLRAVHWAAKGGVPETSSMKAIEPHRRHRYIYHLDLKGAYNQVKVKTLAQILCGIDGNLGSQEEVEAFLTRFCFTDQQRLATGGSASVDLFNIALRPIDEKIAHLAREFGLAYTRYMDDLILSADRPIGHRLRRRIRAIVIEQGYTINHRKSHVWDLTKGPIVVLGVGIEFKGRLFVPRRYIRHVKGLLHWARGQKRPLALAARIAGKMGTVLAVTKRNTKNQTEGNLLNEHFAWQTRLRLLRPERRRKAVGRS